MVSPVHGDYRRCQAEIPLIVLFRFPGPALTEVKVELENRGHHIPLTSLSGPLQQLCQGKELRRTRSDGKFVYSNW